MFKFFKDKLKGALDRVNKKVEEEVDDVEGEIIKEVVKSEEKNDDKSKKKKSKKLGKKEKEKKEEKEVVETKKVGIEEVEEVEKKGLFGKIKEKIITKRISESKFEELFSELEIVMLENNVALEVVDKIKGDLREDLVDKPIQRKDVSNKVVKSLAESINDLFDVEGIDVVEEVRNKKEKPYVLCFVGVNGCGKTTTVAKFANLLKEQGFSVLLVAGDTWRAASIQQLEEHGKNLDVRVIKHNYGSDPAAVAFDGIKAAKAKNIDVVLIDTAGRQHSNKDLMREMEKIIRVANPDLKIFVGESITGNDCVLQAQQFDDIVKIDGVVLTKADIDEKGGAAISVGYVTGKPILYVGKGQNYGDLEKFSGKNVVESLGMG
tara:strand:- start:1903 stop:3033 length:1131 start_codon:yes stop_codon:yes gene_type:complete